MAEKIDAILTQATDMHEKSLNALSAGASTK